MICRLSTGEQVRLNEKDVEAAKKMVNKFLDSVKTSSITNQRPSLYFTTLIIMELQAGDLLSTVESNKLKNMIEALNTTTEKNTEGDR